MKKYHLWDQEIPEGFQIYEERLEVSGIAYRKRDAASFAKTGTGWLELVLEPGNKYDRNAIKVFGCNKGFFGTKPRFIGYVPKEVSALIMQNGYWEKIRPRLIKTYIGKGGFVEILFQILGPKGEKDKYNPQ